jgi:citronellol/citronellal dehydrogenase
MGFRGKTVFITGGSRGIGLAIGKALARDGANIVLTGKTAEPHPKLPGTLYTAAEEVEAAGGTALPIVMDVRDEAQVEAAVAETVERFGRIDILVNNASAIQLTGTLQTPMARFDLMNQINFRGTFMTSQKAIPHMKGADNPHVLNLSPPLSLEPRWFANHVAYTMAKFGMSFCVLAMAEEFRPDGIAFNALWPRTPIATAAVKNLLGGDELIRRSRTDEIMGDAACAILDQPAARCTGNFFMDDDVVIDAGITDLERYAVDPEAELAPDFFIPDDYRWGLKEAGCA